MKGAIDLLIYDGVYEYEPHSCLNNKLEEQNQIFVFGPASYPYIV